MREERYYFRDKNYIPFWRKVEIAFPERKRETIYRGGYKNKEERKGLKVGKKELERAVDTWFDIEGGYNKREKIDIFIKCIEKEREKKLTRYTEDNPYYVCILCDLLNTLNIYEINWSNKTLFLKKYIHKKLENSPWKSIKNLEKYYEDLTFFKKLPGHNRKLTAKRKIYEIAKENGFKGEKEIFDELIEDDIFLIPYEDYYYYNVERGITEVIGEKYVLSPLHLRINWKEVNRVYRYEGEILDNYKKQVNYFSIKIEEELENYKKENRRYSLNKKLDIRKIKNIRYHSNIYKIMENIF